MTIQQIDERLKTLAKSDGQEIGMRVAETIKVLEELREEKYQCQHLQSRVDAANEHVKDL